MKPIVMVSADGHAGAPPEAYRDYIEPQHREELDGLIEQDRRWRDTAVASRRFAEGTLDLIDRGGAIRSGGEFGAWELDRRLTELDREGVAGEILIPGHQVSILPFFGAMNRPCAPELRSAGARAYHRHLADTMAASGGRLFGIADPGPCLDIDETVEELHWVADHGFVGVAPPGQIRDDELPPLSSSYYEPFWAACSDLGLVLNLHAGYGVSQAGGEIDGLLAMMAELGAEEALRKQMTADLRIDQFPKDSATRRGLTAGRRVFWQLMLAGVFDRYPGLKLVLTEVRADWVPDTVAVLDRYFADGHAAHVPHPPSEYWARHCYLAPSSPRPYEIARRHEIGVDKLMFGMDFPHPEGTWPNTREWIRATFAGVPEDEARLILGENAISAYGLDAAHLEAVAETIGLAPDEVLGQHEVDPRLIEQFHARSGFSRPAEQVDPAFYEEMVAEDEAELVGQR
jgi:predicted TIM-barrel fold metal-dependent hydrolase